MAFAIIFYGLRQPKRIQKNEAGWQKIKQTHLEKRRHDKIVVQSFSTSDTSFKFFPLGSIFFFFPLFCFFFPSTLTPLNLRGGKGRTWLDTPVLNPKSVFPFCIFFLFSLFFFFHECSTKFKALSTCSDCLGLVATFH